MIPYDNPRTFTRGRFRADHGYCRHGTENDRCRRECRRCQHACGRHGPLGCMHVGCDCKAWTDLALAFY